MLKAHTNRRMWLQSVRASLVMQMGRYLRLVAYAACDQTGTERNPTTS
jgi:hypothetical protein